MRKIRMMAIGAILSLCGMGTTALAQEASEQFTIATLNVDGLPQKILVLKLNTDGLAKRRMPDHYTLFDIIPDINSYLSKVDLTTDDLEEMCDDAGITQADLLTAYLYLKTGEEKKPAAAPLVERVEAPLYLLRSYENQLAAWFMMAGYDVEYEKWGI